MNIEYVLKGHGIGVGGGSNIKNLQRGKTQFPQTQDTINITINPVDVNKAIVLCKFIEFTQTNNETGSKGCYILGTLTSSTNLRISRYIANGYGYIVWEVIEFNNVKSFQKGTVTNESSVYSNPPVTSVVVNEINPNKSMLFINYKQSGDYNLYISLALFSSEIVDSKNIKLYTGNSGYKSVTNWYLVEFN